MLWQRYYFKRTSQKKQKKYVVQLKKQFFSHAVYVLLSAALEQAHVKYQIPKPPDQQAAAYSGTGMR